MVPTAPDSVLAPVTIARVAQRLDARGAVYGTGSSGDLVARWEDHPFWFIVMGPTKEYLQVRARWRNDVPASELGKVLLAANHWAETVVWPKIFVRIEAGNVAVYTEHTVDYGRGVSDEQLDLHLTGGIATALHFFADLDKRYPGASPTPYFAAPAAADYRDAARPTLE